MIAKAKRKTTKSPKRKARLSARAFAKLKGKLFKSPAKPKYTVAKSSRLEARLSAGALAIVKRAAEIQGRSVSDFVVTAAQEAAHRTIAETDIIRLSVEGQRLFAEAILNPPPPNAALKKAAARHRELIREPT